MRWGRVKKRKESGCDMVKDAKEMTVDELRQEVERIRAERSGRGRVNRATARGKRVDGQVRVRKVKEEAEKVEGAEWI
jgi:hypothetical protein